MGARPDLASCGFASKHTVRFCFFVFHGLANGPPYKCKGYKEMCYANKKIGSRRRVIFKCGYLEQILPKLKNSFGFGLGMVELWYKNISQEKCQNHVSRMD